MSMKSNTQHNPANRPSLKGKTLKDLAAAEGQHKWHSYFREAVMHVCTTADGNGMSDLAKWSLPGEYPHKPGYAVRARDGQRFRVGFDARSSSFYARPCK